MGPRNRGRTVTLRGLWVHPATGRPYHRTRRGGRTVLTPLPPGLPHNHPDFIAAWAAAARGTEPAPAPAAGTLASVVAALLASDTWHRLSPGYRAGLDGHRRATLAAYGALPLRGLREKHVRADVAGAANPRARRKWWRLLLAFAHERGWVDRNEAAGVTVRTARGPRQPGHQPWTAADLAAFRARWPVGTVPRAAMELMHWTGCRVGDATRIGPQMVGRDGVLAYRQTKTGAPAFVPWSCPLPAYAAGMEADRQAMLAALAPLAGHLTFLAARAGRSRSVKALTQNMLAACRAAGLTVTSHGLRKTRAQTLIDNGATPHEGAAWTGHESTRELEHYARGFDRRKAVTGPNPERPVETLPRSSGNRMG